MNKQEAIKELNAKKDENENVFELEDWDTGLKCGARRAYENAINIVKQLDEPEKPIVPQFVADWIETHKRWMPFLSHLFTDNTDGELGEWLTYSDNQELMAKAWLYGYEVEKEKLYEVFLLKNGVQIGAYTPEGGEKSQFTREELKEYGFTNLDGYRIDEVKND